MDISQKILSDITHHMKYARYIKQELRRESYEDTVTRNMLMHIAKFPQLEQEIRDAYKFVLDRRFYLQCAQCSLEVVPSK